MSLAQRMKDKAARAVTIQECDNALADIRETIDTFEPDRGGHLAYLAQLYEERDAFILRRRDLERRPTPEQQVERLTNTLRMINFRAVEGLRGGAPVVLCHDIMNLTREAIYYANPYSEK